ncbi:MAG: ATP-binding cassette domain-containing protein [Erysipelotrichales bacterium]|nr:ATP-binding cassette domain-containing protein [Erysipelotrichales bacterium]MBQ5542555.1 ATP-binding cassette domain-containing protein [Erysipelotrichales bacterium]
MSSVRLEHIHKSFQPRTVSETVVFKDFNLEIEDGTFVSVVGSNGSGKTTMLNMICGNVDPDSGKIFLGDTDLTHLPAYKRTARIGRVFQDPAKGTCASLTVLENLALADNKGQPYGFRRSIDEKRMDVYRHQLQRLHMGLEDKLHVPVGHLSGGQRQALALLIATKSPLDLLVLDEHTAALDPKSAETVMKLTEEIVRKEQVTTIMVTHNLRFAAEYGDRLVMMHEGKSVIDSLGHDKSSYKVSDLLDTFNRISIECGN